MSATTYKLSHLFVMLTFDWTKFFVFVLLRSYVETEDTHGEKQPLFLLFFKREGESEERKTKYKSNGIPNGKEILALNDRQITPSTAS